MRDAALRAAIKQKLAELRAQLADFDIPDIDGFGPRDEAAIEAEIAVALHSDSSAERSRVVEIRERLEDTKNRNRYIASVRQQEDEMDMARLLISHLEDVLNILEITCRIPTPANYGGAS